MNVRLALSGKSVLIKGYKIVAIRMSQERFEKLATIFEHVRGLEPDARSVHLDQACADDPALRDEVLAILDRHDRGGMLDAPIQAIVEPPSPVPKRIGRFRIIDRLGRGGMGVVYRAEQDKPSRQVALKMMHTGLVTQELRRRFEFETSVLARLQHPGIAQIFEVGTWDTGSGPQPFFAMELVEGVALDAYIVNTKPSIKARLELFMAICDAVHHAHQKGVIHRDLKPANILVTSDGLPKILDFGIARATDADLHVTMCTTPGQLVGTLAYMSPEQVSASTDRLDTRSDVYALGVILYELLAEQLPYDLGDSKIASAIRAIEECSPRSLTTVSRALRGDLNTIVLKSLRKKPENRYQSASDLSADLRRFLEHQPIVARPATAWYQFNRFARRHRGLMAGMVGIMIAMIVGAGAVAWQASLARDEARTRRKVANFLREMLTSVNPAKTAGKALTVREMLDTAAADLHDRFQNVPLVRGELHDTVGSTYYQLGAYEDAALHTQQAIEDYQANAGPQAKSTLLAMSSLGLILSKLDRVDEAEAILRAAWQRGATSDETISDNICQNLAVVLDKQGQNNEALHMFQGLFDRIRKRFGANHEATFLAQSNVGSLLVELGLNDEALPLLVDCLKRSRDILGDDHPKTIAAMSNLGALYGNMGRMESLALLQEAVERSERVLGPTHLSTLRRRQQLIRSSLREGKFNATVLQAREFLSLCVQELGQAHSESLAALEILVTALALGGDTDAAERLALEWYNRLETELGAAHRSTGRVALLLMNFYEEMKKSKEQAIWQQRADASSYRARGVTSN